ncbi:MAG: bifunctional tRNA (adenosine(37)-C2)-methyltransferase TrmG/ribosomal RNA large subunit methyltransferase RlmN [Chlamydiales bacterium]
MVLKIYKNKRSAFDMGEQDWKEWLLAQGLKPFIAKQIMQWIFKHHITEPQRFSNLSLSVREELQNQFDWTLLKLDTLLKSQDGSEKFLFKTHDHSLIESVLMPTNNRVTLCVSSQIGCKMGCTFCQTAKMGFGRNLSSGEILSQLIVANLHLASTGKECRVTNVVFMGMGEPLDNYLEVVKSCHIMIDNHYFNLAQRRVTVSTSGLVPEIRQMAHDLPVSLAISLHSTKDQERSSMMPINKKYSLQQLKEALLYYQKNSGRDITFEYVMIDEKNDSIDHAKQLVKFIHGLKASVNLIPMNPHPGSPFKASTLDRLKAFQKYLQDRSYPAPIRYSKAQDVSGACGQLASKRSHELALTPQEVAKVRRAERRLVAAP